MIIYENFIRELLRNNLIRNYTAEKYAVRDFYNKEFRSKVRRSFYEFSSALWRYWYINHYSEKFIYFDQRWINYLSQFEAAQNSPKKIQFVEKNFMDKNSCRVCLVKFSNENLVNTHRNCLKHKVRIQYLTDKDSFTFSEDISLKVEDANNTVHKEGKTTKIIFEQKRNINTTFHIINTSKVEVEIIEIIEINPHLTDLTMHNIFKKGTILKSEESVVIVLNGSFENSTSFSLSLVIVAKYGNKTDIQYFLKEIAIEVKSEFADLKSGEAYSIAEKFFKLANSSDLIIPGNAPVKYISYYKEKYPLRMFEIPQSFQLKLRKLITSYPSFIDRTPLNFMTDFFFKEYAKLLNINPVMNEENYFDLLQNLINIEENQIQVDMRNFDTMSKLNHVEGNIFELEVPGLAEARPSLLVHDSVYIKENKDDTCKYQGIVNKVLENSVRLGFNTRFANIFAKEKIFHIEFGYNRRPQKVIKQALLIAKAHNIVSYFYPKLEPESINEHPNKTINYFNPQLNEEQKRAVKNILEEKSAPYLIFGPPGTGKTVTVVETILQIWKNQPETKILVCAPSNAATNELAQRLVDIIPSTDIFRLLGNMYGQENKLHSKIKSICNIQRDDSFYMPSMEDILKYRVVLTTLVSAARLVNGGIPDGHYNHVFIDESGYATESETLIPIAGILSNSTNIGKVVGQIVLAGDPRQLGPVVHSNFVKYCGYGISMLERLIDTCDIYARNEDAPIPYNQKYVTKLVKNYRSHNTILKIPNKLFYHNELIPANTELSNMFIKWEHLKTADFPVIFHNVIGEDKREKNSPSFFNIQEIEEVIEYISKLVGERVKGVQITQDHIGIITPYRKQAQMLNKACQKKHWNNILIGSVEQFQGKEKLIIIISTVRSKNTNKFEDIDKRCQLGFVRNPKRFNVALTRAKALLIVVGNACALKTDKTWLHFIEYCVNNKSIAGKAFNLSDDEYLNEEIPSENCGAL